MNELNFFNSSECARWRYRDLLRTAERERLVRRTSRARRPWRGLRRTLSLLSLIL